MNLSSRLSRLQALTQRTFTAAQRKKLAAKGWALADGSYPIETAADLKAAAILAKSGHGDVDAAKKLIAKRAKALGVANPLAPKAMTQDGMSGGVLTSGTCPACNAQIMAGVASPDTGKAKKSKKSVKQGAVIIQVDHVHKAMTAIVQSPDIPHLVLVPTTDGQPELASIVYDGDVIRQMCWDFLIDGLQRAVGVDHSEVTDAGIAPPDGEFAVVVQNFCAPVCYEVNGRHITQGSWVQTYQFTDDDVWESVLEGKRSAPSLTAPMSTVELELITPNQE